MIARLRGGLSWAAVLALVAGCGSSSSGSSPARHSAGTAGSRVYAAAAFRIAIPAGFKRGLTVSGAGGASGTVFTTADNRATISLHAYPQATQGVQQALAGQMVSDAVEAQQGSIRQLHSQVRSLTVGGAREAKELTQTFVNAHGPQHLAELIVLTSTGTLIDATATASDAIGIDPASVLSSLQLTAT